MCSCVLTHPVQPAPDTDVDLEAKYRPLYEDAVNPFTVFSRAEKDKRYAQLNAADKLTLSTSKILLQHKCVPTTTAPCTETLCRWGRTFLFVYAVVLHVLVFFSMYRLASGTSHCIQQAPPVTAAAGL